MSHTHIHQLPMYSIWGKEKKREAKSIKSILLALILLMDRSSIPPLNRKSFITAACPRIIAHTTHARIQKHHYYFGWKIETSDLWPHMNYYSNSPSSPPIKVKKKKTKKKQPVRFFADSIDLLWLFNQHHTYSDQF